MFWYIQKEKTITRTYWKFFFFKERFKYQYVNETTSWVGMIDGNTLVSFRIDNLQSNRYTSVQFSRPGQPTLHYPMLRSGVTAHWISPDSPITGDDKLSISDEKEYVEATKKYIEENHEQLYPRKRD